MTCLKTIIIMLYHPAAIPPTFPLLTLALPTLAPVVSTLLPMHPSPILTTALPLSGSRLRTASPRNPCNSPIASPRIDAGPRHAFFFSPYPHRLGPICQPWLNHRVHQDGCEGRSSRRPLCPQGMVGRGPSLPLALPTQNHQAQAKLACAGVV
jgi:hypothetical protein